MPPQSLLQRLSRLVSDALTKDTDIAARWDKIVDDGVGAECAMALGPIPQPTLDDIPLCDAIEYSAADADGTLRINSVLDERIEELGLRPALELDYSVVPIIAEMQHNGMLVDRDRLVLLGEVFSDTLDDITAQCWSLAGCEFNLNSGDQKADILYDKLGLSYGRLTKSKKRIAVDDKALEALKGQHPIVALLQQHAEVAKLQSSYVVTLPRLISEDGRWRYELGMTTIPSGRLNGWGGVNPLGIPTRTELGREIRRCFIAPLGRLLGAVDLNQIELRGLAVLSGDEHLLEAYHAGEDLHRNTAADALYHCSRADITYEQRQRGKTVNFAVANQISALGLRDQFYLSGIADVEETDCQRMLDGWYRHYSAVPRWYQSVYEEGRRNGYIRCPLSGRILWTPGLRSPIDKVRAQAERVATNWELQVFAQVIGKHGLAAIWDYLQSDHIVDPLLFVHDEFLYETDADSGAGPIMSELMTGTPIALSQPIPILAGHHEAGSWAELK